MGKTTQERLASAKANPSRFGTADYEGLIADLRTDSDRLKAQHAKDSEDSITFTLADADRDAAADRAARAAGLIQGIAAELDWLRSQLEERVNSEKAAADQAQRHAALAARDALAARLPEDYAAAAGILVRLAEEIIASDAQMRAAGLVAERAARFAFMGDHAPAFDAERADFLARSNAQAAGHRAVRDAARDSQHLALPASAAIPTRLRRPPTTGPPIATVPCATLPAPLSSAEGGTVMVQLQTTYDDAALATRAYPGMVPDSRTAAFTSRTCGDAAGIGFGKAVFHASARCRGRERRQGGQGLCDPGGALVKTASGNVLLPDWAFDSTAQSGDLVRLTKF